jgi:diguanylate cyclase (GGDEF)-like protein/PAS domain S-box-containing protein
VYRLRTHRFSIYVTLGLIIVLAVSTIVALQGYYSYAVAKRQIEVDMRQSMDRSVNALEKSVAGFVLSYAINEYTKLVANELARRNGFAITVEDYRMGEIMGESAYVSGKIRDADWRIIDYDPDNREHRQQLNASWLSMVQPILDQDGGVIGRLTVFMSDRHLNKRLDAIVTRHLIDSVAISVLLIVSLFISIRLHLLRPIAHIIATIGHTDEEGIPLDRIDCDGPREIRTLTETMNRMLESISQSRRELRLRHDELQEERERFQLAIDGTQDGLWDWNLRTDQVYHSPRFEIMLGYEVGDLADTIECWNELIHPDDREKARQLVRKYLESKGAHAYENRFRMRTKGGDWLWITARGKAQFAGDGTPSRFVGFNTDVTRLVRQQEELHEQKNLLQHQATHDALTGLANRTLLNDRLEQGIAKARRHQTKMALLFIDLDHFKEINDSLGHRVGDQVLGAVTQRLQKIIRTEDTLARLGGDEFTILLEGLRQEQDASLLAGNILQTLTRAILLNQHELYVGCSIGISIYPDNGKTARDLLKNADAAMYKAKNEGRNNFQYYSAEMTTQAFERVHMEAGLRAALTHQEFMVFYQPQINANSNELVGMEALVRWENPNMGMISPAKFIPIAESTGLIVELDRWVMRQAVQQFVKWYQQGLQPGVLAMNLSMKQLHKHDFLSFLVNLMIETNCSPDRLELEVTEGLVMENPEDTIQVLHKIDDIGIRLALDDFGTGYSSLAYLKRLPINKLKIDQSFVHGLPDDAEDAAISRAVIALAQSLELDILAEGAEHQAQIDFLVENGCHTFQGYHYAKPLPARDMQVFLERRLGRNVTPLSSKPAVSHRRRSV